VFAAASSLDAFARTHFINQNSCGEVNDQELGVLHCCAINVIEILLRSTQMAFTVRVLSFSKLASRAACVLLLIT